MAHLPSRPYSHYGGLDVGFKGALGVLDRSGKVKGVWDLPVIYTGDDDSSREFDLPAMEALFLSLAEYHDLVLGIEWPTTRPGEGAERSERFGRGKGYIEAFAYLTGIPYFKLPPNLWKPALGLPGKDHPQAIPLAHEHLNRHHPESEPLIYGPLGGLKDGRIEALLIAHFLWDQRISKISDVVKQYGKGSDEAVLACLTAGPRRRHRIPRPLPDIADYLKRKNGSSKP